MKFLARLAAIFLAYKTYKATRAGIEDPAQQAAGRSVRRDQARVQTAPEA